MCELLFFDPIFKERVWGGSKICTEFGYDIKNENIGECWAISAHTEGDCVCSNGAYKGRTLSDLWAKERKIFGNMEGDRFPLLVKIIDAKEKLSIQVHPDDEYAAIHENGELGKSECWYILDCDDDAMLVLGHNAKSREELTDMIDKGRYDELIRTVKIQKGDFVQIDPGTVHSINGGVMLLETQQNSDVTYRVYDYNRMYNGALRELHVDKSKEVITVPSSNVNIKKTSLDKNKNNITILEANEKYIVTKIDVIDSVKIGCVAHFMTVSCVGGQGYANETRIKKGDFFIVPYGYGEIEFSGKLELVIAEP